LDAVRGSLTANRRAERPTEPNSGLVSVEELVGVLLQQAGRAEEPDSCRGDVIGWQLERPEHSAAIEERPSHVADALDSNAISESTEMSRRSLIERAHKVTPIVRN
jgi:hypothetical protein